MHASSTPTYDMWARCWCEAKMCIHIPSSIFTSISTGTFDVQNIELLEDPPGNFCVHCIFANGSKAKGCHIKLEESMRESKAYRNTSCYACIQVAERGTYTLTVYDIEENEADAITEISALRPAINRTIFILGSSTLIFLSPIWFTLVQLLFKSLVICKLKWAIHECLIVQGYCYYSYQ